MNVLQRYMIEKTKLFKAFGEYAVDADIEELATWSKVEVDAVAASIAHNLRVVQREVPTCYRIMICLLTTSTCPWCQRRDRTTEEQAYVDDCTTCGYGKRHLLCEQPGSDWKKTYTSLHQHITVAMYIPPEIAVEEFTEMAERYIDYPLQEVLDRLIALLNDKGDIQGRNCT